MTVELVASMDPATKFGEPISFDACDRIEAHGVTALDAARVLVSVGLVRVRQSLSGKALAEELSALAATLLLEADALQE